MTLVFGIFFAVVLSILVVGSLKFDDIRKLWSSVSFGRRRASGQSYEPGPGRLGVMLALAVAAADGSLDKAKVAIIRKWANRNIKLEGGRIVRYINHRRLNAALNEAVVFFRSGNQFDAYSVCKELIQTATVAFRYDILELCLYVAGANGVASEKALDVLQKYAKLLGAGADKFRNMMERILPVMVHETVDTSLLLGVNPNMDAEEVREGLNKEYSKWNARTWNHNPRVQEQAEQMLQLIADTRKEYKS